MSVNSHHKKVTEKENDFNKTQTPEVHSELHRTQEMKEKVSKTKKKDSSVPLDSVDVENHVNIDSQESLNPESAVKENGEIDWDCPCLQGMAHGIQRLKLAMFEFFHF
ncbi:hypothetical protein Zmor_012263 [Zophobas morio]|jgi:hypothetical protein|uniref:Uncharacterized protein n=1 Tax=Zophobas morio TaxID=2755281 RepID=A0AA38LZR7_9CUCU|nr:hypothetical protein Zmor_012263 [Zophobas morio]